ncbi:butyrate kinase [Streptococcus zalophi]|nr:butyrate kinase [Streptococcus zalophi]MCR8967031.1 butyrate kinase [Streptococcus zalophi]
MYQILVINLGSTSTKIAFFEDQKKIIQETVKHPTEDLMAFNNVSHQIDYRKAAIEDFMTRHHIDKKKLDAVVSRGGNTRPIESGIYEVTPFMIEEQLSGVFGSHPTDLGSSIAYQLKEEVGCLALVVDPPASDEFSDLARVSGHPKIVRISSVHALNHKAIARQYAKDIGNSYEALNLIVVHMGGGNTVVPHYKGRMIDGGHGLYGENAFTTNRSGGLPVTPVIEMCFSGNYTKKEMIEMINGKGGLTAYLGTADVKEIEEKSVTDEKMKFYLDAMIYQVAKDIGSMAVVLKGDVDAILITGGIAHSEYVTKQLKEYCEFIAPIKIYPGEKEMESLANGACTALKNPKQIINFDDYVQNKVTKFNDYV